MKYIEPYSLIYKYDTDTNLEEKNGLSITKNSKSINYYEIIELIKYLKLYNKTKNIGILSDNYNEIIDGLIFL